MKPFINVSARTGNVVFNFRGDPINGLVPFAMGYHEAARTLSKPFKGNGYAEYNGYPVLFLYRHALELYLKAVVYHGAQLMTLINEKDFDHPDIFRNHRLPRLVPVVREIFKAMNWSFANTKIGSFDAFEELIGQLDSIDAESFTFRYPTNTKGEAATERHLTVNVWIFAQIMDEVLGYLYGATELLDERFQSTAEARYEMQRLMADEGYDGYH
jgi:hypothetical protein